MDVLRSTVHKGMVAVSGIRLPAGHAPRVLGAWRSGASLRRLEDGSLLLRFAAPVTLRCETAPGEPLVAADRVLTSAPIGAVHSGRLPSEGVVVVSGGAITVLALREMVDPAVLLDLAGWTVVRPQPPPPPPPPEPVPAALLPLEVFDTRQRLGVGAPDETTVRSLRKLASPKKEGAGSGNRGRATGSIPRPAAARMPTGRAPLGKLLRRALLATGLTERAMRAHQRYFDQLNDLFERGRLDEALRRAIPFGGEGDGEGRLALQPPAPRSDLRIDPRRSMGGSSVPLAPAAADALRAMYRQAHQRLDQQDRVMEAAFVLCELLDATEEACAYLERKGELRLAAELAESRSTDPALVVRLWWLAGDRERALLLSRRYGCFAPVVARLERHSLDDDAAAFRLAWSQLLVQAGDLVGAYDVCADVEGGAELATWRAGIVETGIAGGGPLRARMLARHLRLGTAEPHETHAEILGQQGSPEDRRLVALDLLTRSGPVDHPGVVRNLLRALLSDEAALTAPQLDQLVRLTRDPVLRADLPPFSTRTGGLSGAGTPPEAHLVRVHAADRGLVPVLDARVLPGGLVALALGEVGVRLARFDGRTAHHWDVPAQWLIPSDTGTRLLAGRDLGSGVVSVQALDLFDRTRRHLGELMAPLRADSYDGAHWFVGDGEEVLMLDVLAPRPRAIWRLHELDGPLLALARDAHHLSFLVRLDESGDGLVIAERHTYELPLLLMRHRHRLAVSGPGVFSPDGQYLQGCIASGSDHVLSFQASNDECGIAAYQAGKPELIVSLQLGGVTTVSAHIDHGLAVIADALGRVEILDLDRRAPRPGSGSRSDRRLGPRR